METDNKIKAYKGFNSDMTCRGFQFEVGKEYEESGKIEACENGFHACENPMDVMDYYFIGKDGHIARFCQVEQSGDIDRRENKVASSRITIKAELKFADFIKLAVNFIMEKCKGGKKNTKNYAQMASSGDSAKMASSGDSAQMASSGYYAVVMATGYKTKVKAKKGSWITLTEWEYVDNKWKPVCVKTEQVDGERIKEDTWYILVNGQFKEIE